MVGAVDDMAQVLAALQRERARLLGKLHVEPAWQAWLQLDARETDGDLIDGIDGGALRTRLAARLDIAVPGWRALTGIEVALTVLTATPMLVQSPEAATEPAATVSPVAFAERPSPLGVIATRPEVRPHLDFRETTPSLDSAADARNRSLVHAMGAIHALGASGDVAKATEPPPYQRPATDCDLNARTVLGRIRSVDGERRVTATHADAARGKATPPPIPSTPATGKPAAATGSSATVGNAGRLPEPKPTTTGTSIQLPPPLPVAARPVAPEPTSAAATAAPSLNPDSSARIAALEQELERLMLRNIETRRPSGLSTPAIEATALSSNASELDHALDEDSLEEAEIEIVPLPEVAMPPDASDDLHLDATSGDGRDAPGPLTRQLRTRQVRQAAEADHDAIYHGIIDEASVEIVQLASSPPDSAPTPQHRSALRLVRDD